VKLALDHHYPTAITEQLRTMAHDAVAAVERGWHREPDETLLALCLAEHRTLLINNVGDFMTIIRSWTLQGQQPAGLIFTSDASLPRTHAAIGRHVKLLDDTARRGRRRSCTHREPAGPRDPRTPPIFLTYQAARYLLRLLNRCRCSLKEGFVMPTFKNDPVESSTDSTSPAVIAENTNTTLNAGVGVHAKSAAAGVIGESTTWHGVAGITQSKTGGAGVFGAGDTGGPGVIGTSKTWIGVFGETFGKENGPAGVWADGHEGGSGVKGHTSCPGAFGVAGFHLTNQGPGIYGQGNPAGLFNGDVNVMGALNVQGSNILQRIGALEQRANNTAQLETRINTLDQKIAELNTELSKLQNQVNNLTSRVSFTEASINDLTARVTALGG